MLDGREDQAAGLRRLFRRAPPQVVALYAGGRRRADNAVLAAHRLAGRSQRVLVLDEAEAGSTLSAALGVGEGVDLLQLLDGRSTLADVVQAVPGLGWAGCRSPLPRSRCRCSTTPAVRA